MSVYVMADIHGEYDKFLEMLDTIQFQEEDELFILGDMIDRGPKPIKLLMDLSMRPNVFCLLGNHEYMAMKTLEALDVEITEENYDKQLSVDVMQGYMEWMQNGGEVTVKQYRALSVEDKEGIREFLNDLALYEIVRVAGINYVMVHAGFMNFSVGRSLDDYAAEELIFQRTDYSKPYFERAVTITGHTPTISITGESKIYQENRHINVDCGAAFPGGRLACLCLDTMEEYYIE